MHKICHANETCKEIPRLLSYGYCTAQAEARNWKPEMSAQDQTASLTVYRDHDTGAQIALAVHRAAGGVITPVPWQKLPGVGLDEAVDAALRAARTNRAFAMLVPAADGRAVLDPVGVLSRCFLRADLDRLSVGPEMRGASKLATATFAAE